jgi:hypothetical protein
MLGLVLNHSAAAWQDNHLLTKMAFSNPVGSKKAKSIMYLLKR